MEQVSAEQVSAKTVSSLELQGSYDGATWWVGGYAIVRGAAGATSYLVRAGDILACATVGEDEKVFFFNNKPLIPIGYSCGWRVDVNKPGLEGKALIESAIGPELIMRGRPSINGRDHQLLWEKHMTERKVICSVPVGIVSQSWMPSRLSKREQLLGANNVIMLMDDEDTFIRWSH